MGYELNHFEVYGYKRDREQQLRELANNKLDSLAMEAANQIRHLKARANKAEESVRTIHTFMLNCDRSSPIWDVVLRELESIDEAK